MDYNVAISVDDTKALGLEKPDDVTILAVVILPEDYTQATANLKGSKFKVQSRTIQLPATSIV